MRLFIASCALLAGIVSMQGPVLAQGKSAPVYAYCLQESGGFRGGTGQILCRFNTLAQCWASKSSPADFCYRNPAYGQKK